MSNGKPQVPYEAIWAEQENIEALVSQKRSASNEVYWPNNNYGAARVLKEYAGYPISKPLFAIVPHGVYMGVDKEAPPGEKEVKLPAVLSFPEYLDRAFRRSTHKVAIPSAAPFLYALARVGGLPHYEERKGLIYFPAHSTSKVHVHAPLEEIADRLLELPEEYQPVTVCVHWFDHSQGLHKPFADRGIGIVTAGHLQDDLFMYRLIHLFAVHKYAGSNRIGSNAWYALASGLPYWITPGIEVSSECAPDFRRADSSEERLTENERIRGLFAELPTEISDEQRDLADYYLGAERFKTRDGLLADLLYAEKLAQQT